MCKRTDIAGRSHRDGNTPSVNEYHPTNCSPNAGGGVSCCVRRTTNDVLQDAQFVSINSSTERFQGLVMKISESEKRKKKNLQDKDIEDDCKKIQYHTLNG